MQTQRQMIQEVSRASSKSLGKVSPKAGWRDSLWGKPTGTRSYLPLQHYHSHPGVMATCKTANRGLGTTSSSLNKGRH